jgi:hypothetical protein
MTKPTMRDGRFWDLFGRGLLSPEDRPTPQAAADFVVELLVEGDKLRKEIADLQHKRKCDAQQFDVFLMEVSNVANRYNKPVL